MIKTIDITNITDEMIEVAAASAQLRAMAGVTEHDALIRGSILAALIVAPALEPAQSYAEPVAWKHDCAALLTNGVELWIDACPHCGKPRTAAIEPAQAVRSGSCSNLMWATAEMREREHNRIGKMVGVLEQIKQEKLSALEPAQAVPQHVIEASNRIPQNIIETPKAVPVAWRTFDGEGGYEFRSYDENETYQDDFIKSNGAKYSGWVEPLYTHPAPIDSDTKRITGTVKQAIENLFDAFFDFPTGDRTHVTSVSCKLFALHVARLIEKHHGIGAGND